MRRRVMGALLSSLLSKARAARPVVRHATAPAAARYFVVGDVHGCLDELHDLLRKARSFVARQCSRNAIAMSPVI